jgi:uncharacterized protein YceK
MKWLAILLVAFFTGCGTVRNFSPVWNDEQPYDIKTVRYGGVKTDLAEFQDAARDLRRYPQSQAPVLANSQTLLTTAIDTPASFVGDTVTLPLALWAELQQGINNHYRRPRESFVTEAVTSPQEPSPSTYPPIPSLDHHHWAR